MIPKLPYDKIKDSSTLPNKLNQKVLVKDEENDRLYLKVFLLDSTINGNKWGVDPETVDDNIQSAIGKPLVLYKNTGKEHDKWYYPRIVGMYDHPPWDDVDINHTYEMQDNYKVGTFIDVVKNHQTGAWWGIAEITNGGVKKALSENPTLPFYVSPSIRRLHQQQANQTIRDWVLMHSAIVSVPAFGVQKAYTGGTCAGDKDSCILHLKTASLQGSSSPSSSEKKDSNNTSENNCGFCTENAMKEIAGQITTTNNGTKNQNNNIDTSHLIFSSNLKTRQSLSDPSQTISSGNENVVVPNIGAGPETVTSNVTNTNSQPDIKTSTVNAPNGVTVEHKTYPQPQQTTVYPNNSSSGNVAEKEDSSRDNNNNSNNKNEELIRLIAENERKQKQLQAAYNQINKLAQDNEKLAMESHTVNTEIASLRKYVEEQKQIARENEIADIILSGSLSEHIPDEAKEEQIRLLSSLPISVEDIRNKITAPWYTALDKVVSSYQNNGDGNAQASQNATTRMASRRIARLPLGENKSEQQQDNNSNTKNASLKPENNSNRRYNIRTPAELLGISGGSV